MKPCFVALAALIITSLGFSESLLAESGLPQGSDGYSLSAQIPLGQSSDWWPPYPPASSGGTHGIDRGPGGYFSPIKLGLMLAIFLLWVRLADWINRDATRFGEHTGQKPEVWNPISIFVFLAGFIAVLTIPNFIAGFPIYFFTALLPFTIYLLQRKGKIPEEAKTGELFSSSPVTETKMPIDLQAAGDSGDQKQANLIKARQSPVFEQVAQMLFESARTGVEQVLLDYGRESVNHQLQVDGIWHRQPPMDRESGDAILWTLKTLANLNPAERQRPQKGVVNGKIGREKLEFDLSCQGIKTGERVLIKLVRTSGLDLNLQRMGMAEETVKKLMTQVGAPGMVVISAPPTHGLTSTWRATLENSDRFTRDFVGVADRDERETERENIEIRRIESGQTPADILPSMILKEPNTFVMPLISDKGTMDLLTDQVNAHGRTVITKVAANSAVEAILRLMAVSGDRSELVRSITVVTNQRLVRRLCDKCKQPVQANPQSIRQMGGDPAVHTIYKDYQLPPVEQQVDEEGKPITMEPCAACTGIGFKGRTAIYETVVVDDVIRQALLKNPKLDFITQVARKQGNLTLLQQAYLAVLEGRTSMAEVQRVFQPKK